MPEAAYWRKLEAGRVACELCPHGCELREGQTGICRVRRNEGGSLRLPAWGAVSALALDPIEKKPLYHFLPGTEIFSVGFFGCNLRCPFCQNWEISQTEAPATRLLSPEQLVAEALRSGAPSLAFTYSEPVMHFEYILEAATLAQRAGLATVLVTNGELQESPAEELLRHLDAANIDLKCWSSGAYREKLGGDLLAVQRFIALAAQSTHIEVTTLVVPELDDWQNALKCIAAFLASLSPEIPLHLSAYHPAYLSRRSSTEPTLLRQLGAQAREQLRFVYLGNLPGEGSAQHCTVCGAQLIARRGYVVDSHGLTIQAHDKTIGEKGSRWNAACRACGNPAPFILPVPHGTR